MLICWRKRALIEFAYQVYLVQNLRVEHRVGHYLRGGAAGEPDVLEGLEALFDGVVASQVGH